MEQRSASTHGIEINKAKLSNAMGSRAASGPVRRGVGKGWNAVSQSLQQSLCGSEMFVLAPVLPCLAHTAAHAAV